MSTLTFKKHHRDAVFAAIDAKLQPHTLMVRHWCGEDAKPVTGFTRAEFAKVLHEIVPPGIREIREHEMFAEYVHSRRLTWRQKQVDTGRRYRGRPIFKETDIAIVPEVHA